MATPHTIPSKLNTSTNVSPSDDSRNLYITSCLYVGALLTVDTVDTSSTEGVVFVSPIICKTFTAAAAGSVSYFEK